MKDGLRQTALCAAHEALGARMVDFGGWYMPVQYSGVMEEHRAVREAAGLFDVSHMGEIRVRGPQACGFLEWLTPNAPSALAFGQCHYTFLLNERGTVLDDLLIYRFAESDFLLVVNASNQDADLAWIQAQADTFDVSIENEGPATSQLAIQGPRAEAILSRVLGIDLAGIRYYWFTRLAAPSGEMLVSRTGYTGEDGFEIYLPWQAAEPLWNALLEAGKDDGLLPAGLGARDTLRLEARMALYGHELDAQTTPLEAGLGWVIKWDKGDFIGRKALLEQKAAGLPRKLVCLEMTERGVPRQGYPLLHQGQTVGVVSSGTHSPTLNRPIAMGFLPPGLSQAGTELHIAIRGKAHGMRVVLGPFYKRKA